jgi:hypothetical protein
MLNYRSAECSVGDLLQQSKENEYYCKIMRGSVNPQGDVKIELPDKLENL